jgi:hypothetical protein
LVELLLARRVAGRIPHSLRASFDDAWNRAVARLVLDDVLRLRTRNGFVGGARAHARVFGAGRNASDGATGMGSLSLGTLRIVCRMPTMDLNDLARALYCGHRLPVTPGCLRRFPTAAATRGALLSALDDRSAALVRQHWQPGELPEGSGDWLFWSSRHGRAPRSAAGVSYKLYISPAVPDIAEAFRRCVVVFAELGVTHFKIGSGAYALCRPDKFVAYFATRDALDACAGALRNSLQGLRAHGVPFCAPVDDDGLVSWGVDFREAVTSRRDDEQTSWRMWVCQRLAGSVVRARDEASLRIPVWRYALDRLALDGVSPYTFAPTPEFVKDAAFHLSDMAR